MKDEPTNDPAVLRRNPANCDHLCKECAKSMCLATHQIWRCRCGHLRGAHLNVQFYHYGMYSIPNHPHPCRTVDCDCDALVYEVESDLISNEEAVAGLLGFIEDLED